MCNAVKELQSSGEVNRERESFQTLLAFGMTNWISFWFDYGRRVNAEELAETLVHMFLYGVLQRSPENAEASASDK